MQPRATPARPVKDDATEDDPLEALVAEIVVLRERGRDDALDQVCRAHPDEAAELRERCARLAGVQGALAELKAVAREQGAPHRFGHYTIVRELGRGGMGVVYLARDERLGREVALKAMTAPALAGAHGRKRFEREVQAVAALEHPGIVPIFEAGEEHGAPYFTMQYVEGQPLSNTLAELRGLGLEPARLTGAHLGGASSAGSGGERSWSRGYLELASRLVLGVAEALQHAHEHGILHRDVKPSNVLLRADGRALLCDFGLARFDVEGSVTRTGDFVGTPHYVSPEQLLGGKVALDARTDVYALGVTLYELLTLRVPFEGATTQEVFNKIAVKEPVAVRRLNPAVPRDLETICHTAMAKDRDQRYASAAELAADLRRFLQFRPVLARPVGPWSRALRWTRRNPAPAAAVVLGTLLVVVGPLSFGLYSHAARRALEREQQATEAQRDRADARAAEAELQRERADRNVARVLRTIDEMLTRVAQDDLAHLPRMDLVRREFLERALALHRELLAEEGDDPALVRDTVRAQRRVGNILYDLGRLEEAGAAAQRAIAAQRGLVESSHGAPQDLAELAADLTLAAHVAGHRGDAERPGELLREAVALRERVTAAAPEDGAARGALADAYLNLGGEFLRRGRQRDAERELRRSLHHYMELLEHEPGDPAHRLARAEATINLCSVLVDDGRLEEAEHVGREALSLWRELLDVHPDWYAVRLGSLKATGNLAGVLADRGAADEALPLIEETIRWGTALHEERPEVPEYAEVLAGAHGTSIEVLAATGRPEEAIAAALEAFTALEDLTRRFPELRTVQRRRVQVLDSLAAVYDRLGRGADELRTREQAVEARRALVAADPESITQHSRMGGALNNLARATAEAGDPERAAELLTEAIEHQRTAFDAEPDHPQYRGFLRNHLWGLAETSLAAGDPERAAAAARQLPALDRHGGEEHRRAAGLLARCAAMQGRAPDQELEALALLRTALARRATDLDDLSTAPDLAHLRATPGFDELLAAARDAAAPN